MHGREWCLRKKNTHKPARTKKSSSMRWRNKKKWKQRKKPKLKQIIKEINASERKRATKKKHNTAKIFIKIWNDSATTEYSLSTHTVCVCALWQMFTFYLLKTGWWIYFAALVQIYLRMCPKQRMVKRTLLIGTVCAKKNKIKWQRNRMEWVNGQHFIYCHKWHKQFKLATLNWSARPLYTNMKNVYPNRKKKMRKEKKRKKMVFPS